MATHPVVQLGQSIADCDFAVLAHGFLPHGRDYFMRVQDCIGHDPGTHELRFTHCVRLDYETRVRDDAWPISWSDDFLDYQRWKAASGTRWLHVGIFAGRGRVSSVVGQSTRQRLQLSGVSASSTISLRPHLRPIGSSFGSSSMIFVTRRSAMTRALSHKLPFLSDDLLRGVLVARPPSNNAMELTPGRRTTHLSHD